MIQICRAEDGESFQVSATLRDIERRGSLELFLHQEIGVDQDAILAYLSDGTRLRTDNVRELVGAHDQTIFVFNKYHLDIDMEDVLQELRVEPPLQPPIEEVLSATPPYKPSQLAASYFQNAHTYLEYMTHTLLTLHRQHQAVQIAASSLDLNVLAITDAFDGIVSTAGKDLQRQAALLAGIDADLEIINRVEIHVEFMSPAVRNAIENGERPRKLGDYVSKARMKQVADTCARTHDDLRKQFSDTETAVVRLTSGTDVVRATVTNRTIIEEAEISGRRFHDAFDKASDIAAALESPATDSDTLLQVELKQLDSTLRHEVAVMTDAKNVYTEQCIGVLRRISALNVDLVQLPTTLSQLQTRFRTKNSFLHIQRLHNMLYAYGATVIEIVRRKEFSRFFYQRAQSILEVMAKLSASERKRRQVYRGEVHGQLPFETRGMDDPVPLIDFSPSGSKDFVYTLERTDVDGKWALCLLRVILDLEDYARSSPDPAVLGSVQESRFALEKLVQRMDNLESGFDRIAERSLLSASRLSASRRKLTEADEMAFQELTQELQNAEEAKLNLEKSMQQERTAFQAEIHRLNADLHNAEVNTHSERERVDTLERELHQARAQIESEVTARRILERRNAELTQDLETQRQERSKALADATEQAMVADGLRQELLQVRTQAEEVKALEAKNAAKITQLLEEQTTSLRKLEEARSRGEDLQAQICAARAENDGVNRLLKQSDMEKERLLRAQASEHDRLLRDHIAEADGDRAVLEHQFSELKAQLEDSVRQLKDAEANVELTNADAVGLREELQRVEHELREARHVERLLRNDLTAGRTSQSAFEQRLENSSRMVAELLDVAIAFRNAHFKALSIVQSLTVHPNAKQGQNQGMVDLAFSPGLRHGAIPEEPSPLDPFDLPGALETLRTVDHDHFLENITKTGSVIRKWQKQCKEYRERAKGKISFRNFAKGDLALFLPTRNSVSKPWAAFNVSFPHYFLLAAGHLAEQLKTREWIVARITSITERVVDQKDPSSNPYSLGHGIKYYMLEVEDWTQSGQLNKRRPNLRKASALSDPENERKNTPTIAAESPMIPPGPPQAEVEDAFSATQPPTSHLFPTRPRANSTPSAGPSSLSRLLAQASPDITFENALETLSPPGEEEAPAAATTSSPPAPSPTLAPAPVIHSPTVVPYTASPLRPGSRASRVSVSSRYSAARLPSLVAASSSSATAKAVATTALTEHTMPSAIAASRDPSSQAGPSLPQDLLPEGVSNILLNRRRTTSHHVSRSSPLGAGLPGTPPPQTATSALAQFASNLGVPFGRRKKAEAAERPFSEIDDGQNNSNSAPETPNGL
ncbi:putative peripheral membrane protein [Phlebopus sp. FC_14]|nr:putative peripheral membrane protein [Phlebopus sp. FC_14]